MRKSLLIALLILATPLTTLTASFGGNYDDIHPFNRNRHANYGIREELLQQRVWNNTIYYDGQRINPYNGQPREYRPHPLIRHDGLGYF